MPERLPQGGFLIAKIHQLSGRILAKMMKQRGLQEINPAQGRILFVLWEKDEISIMELAQKTQLGKSTLTTMLDRLEKMDFIRRVPSKDDRRKTLIQRTEKDLSFQETYYDLSKQMTALYYRGFSSKEMEAFEGYLDRILGNLLEEED